MKGYNLWFKGAVLCFLFAGMGLAGCSNGGTEEPSKDVTAAAVGASDIAASGAETSVTESNADDAVSALTNDKVVSYCLSEVGQKISEELEISEKSGSSTYIANLSVPVSTFGTDIRKIMNDLYNEENQSGKLYDLMSHAGTNYSTSYSADKSWNDIQLGIDGVSFSIPTYKLDLSAGETKNGVFSGSTEMHVAATAGISPAAYVAYYNNKNSDDKLTTCLKGCKFAYAVNTNIVLDSFNYTAFSQNMENDPAPSTDVLRASTADSLVANGGISFITDEGVGGKLIFSVSLSCATDYKTIYDLVIAKLETIQSWKAGTNDAEIKEFLDSLPITVKARAAFYDDAGTETYVYIDTTKLSGIYNFAGSMIAE